MKKGKHIQLVPGTKLKHLRVWCSYCKTVVKACNEIDGGPLKECPHIERLSYRFVGFIPGTRQRVVRSLGISFAEAIKQAAILKQQLENGTVETVREKSKGLAVVPVHNVADTQPELLTHLFGKYLASLNGENVPAHLKVVRSKGHINTVKTTFKFFVLAIRDAGFDPKTFRLVDISDAVIGKLHDRLIAHGYSNSSYNRSFSHLTTFAGWCEREDYGSVKRFFEKVPRKTVTPRPEIITAEEFEKTIAAISHENGWQYNIGKKKEKRNHYRDYLVPAFRFALIAGRRLEEILTCRFGDVHTDEKGNARVIEFTDHKVSRILHVAQGEERKLFTPVTKEILDFLISQGYGKRSTDDFILAPEILHRRVAEMRQCLTRGFSHFFKQGNTDCRREVSFKTLRKTYLTNLAIHMGKDVTAVSGHSDTQVLRHYLNEKQLAAAMAMQNFSVFGKAKRIETARKKLQSKQKDIER